MIDTTEYAVPLTDAELLAAADHKSDAEKTAVDLQPADPDKIRRRAGTPKPMGAALGEETGDEPEICSSCKESHFVLHVDREKPLCDECRGKKNADNLKKINDLKKHWQGRGSTPPKFRASFGYGCTEKNADTTCFRFMLPSGSWGMPVYMAGDHTFYPSEANSFYDELTIDGWIEE
jgi:hypothetical protein